MESPVDIVSRIKAFFRREEDDAKTVLVTEGRVASRLFFIEKGLARAWFDHDGKEVTFQFILEGQFVSSFESLLSHIPSWYSIETLEPVVVYSVTADEFRQRMEQFPHIREFYHSYVQQRLFVYQQLFVSRIKESPEERYRDLIRQHPE